MGSPVFVLIHSPAAPAPQWRHVPEAVRAATAEAAAPVVLVGHSGAGLLLPAIADALTVDVAALVFVDSFLPPASGSLRLAPAGLMSQLRALASHGSDRFENRFRYLIAGVVAFASHALRTLHAPIR
jgi:alpha-beta hydrolase superfamily lysophospholipase